jgi:hypothetical protein
MAVLLLLAGCFLLTPADLDARLKLAEDPADADTDLDTDTDTDTDTDADADTDTDTDSPPIDADGDGVSEADGDCDDTDATVGPGFVEVCDDGVVNDCNPGAVGCGPGDRGREGRLGAPVERRVGVENLQAAHQQQKKTQRVDPVRNPHNPRVAIDRLAGTLHGHTAP